MTFPSSTPSLASKSKQRYWSITWSDQMLAANHSDIQTLSANNVIDLIKAFPVTFKDDKRSLVLKGALFNKTVIAKQPRDKNRRTWSQLLSLLRPAEAKHSFYNLQRFADCAISAAQPIALLEQHSIGRVVDSWLIYEYIEGVPSTQDDLVEIVQLIDQLHKHNYQHNDPHYKNFLKNASGELLLIDCKGKKRVGNFTDCYDFMLLNSYHPEASIDLIKQHASFKTDSFGYQCARVYAAYKELRSQWKKKLRKNRV